MTRKRVRRRDEEPTFAHALVPARNISGIVGRCINAGIGHKSLLRVKTADIANLRHKLRTGSRANAEHPHNNGILRQSGGQCLHFLFSVAKCSRGCFELRHSLFHEKLCGAGHRHNANVSTGFGGKCYALFPH